MSVNASHPLDALEEAQIVDHGLGGVGALGGGRMYNIITGTRHPTPLNYCRIFTITVSRAERLAGIVASLRTS